MKSKVLLSMAVVAFFFIQGVAAQKVDRILQNEEKRQMLYSSIINNDERYQEFMEMAKASGKMNDDEPEVLVVVDENVEEHPAVAVVYDSYANEQVMSQMVVLMKELVEKDPDLEKVINERCPEMGKAMKKVQ